MVLVLCNSEIQGKSKKVCEFHMMSFSLKIAIYF